MGISTAASQAGSAMRLSPTTWSMAKRSNIAWIAQKRPSCIGGCAARRRTAASSGGAVWLSMFGCGDGVMAEGVEHRLAPRFYAQLRQDHRDVALNGTQPEPKLVGDALVRHRPCQQGKYLD